MKSIVCVFLIWISNQVFGQNSFNFNDVDGEKCQSYLIVNGASNINKFEFYTHINNVEVQNEKLEQEITLNIPVSSFSTNRKMMLRDFMNLLQVEKYPTIQISFPCNFINHHDSYCSVPFQITMAGKTNLYHIPVKVIDCKRNGTSLLGSQKLKLTDFHLVPPQKMAGLIKVKNEITINFRITAN